VEHNRKHSHDQEASWFVHSDDRNKPLHFQPELCIFVTICLVLFLECGIKIVVWHSERTYARPPFFTWKSREVSVWQSLWVYRQCLKWVKWDSFWNSFSWEENHYDSETLNLKHERNYPALG